MSFLDIGAQTWGYLAAVGASLFFGTQGVPVKDANVDPIVYQTYFNIPIFALSWLLLIYNRLIFTPWGILSAALWLITNIVGIHSVNRIGVALASGIGSGTAMTVSFVAGVVLFGKSSSPQNLPLSIVSLFVLITGVALIAVCGTQFPRKFLRHIPVMRRFVSPPIMFSEQESTSFDDSVHSFRSHRPSFVARSDGSTDEEFEISSSSKSTTSSSNDNDLMSSTSKGGVTRRKSVTAAAAVPDLSRLSSTVSTEQVRHRSIPANSIPGIMTPPSRRASVAVPATTESSIREKLMGYACAFVSGTSNGLSLIPLKYSPYEAQGIVFVWSFSIGVAILTPAIFVASVAIRRRLPELHVRVALPWALLGGTLWSIGNFSATYAAILLGISMGVPLSQCALLVAALWGVAFFREIRGVLEIGIFVLGAVVIVGGAFMLGRFG